MPEDEKKMSWPDWIREKDDPAGAHNKPEALDHLNVLDCSYGSIAGCFASSILGELGAEVIRIEAPEGNPERTFSPWGMMHKDTGLGYLNEGRNKFHITLNLQSQEGQEIFRKLAKRADVVIETFLPGVMDSWGIGYRQLAAVNPKLIYCAIYAYGQFGSKAICGKADVDVACQAFSGVTAVTGELPDDPANPKPSEVPTKQGNWMSWYAGGAFAGLAVLAALHYRTISGKGQFIDVAPPEAMGRLINYSLNYYQEYKEDIPRVGNYDVGVFPYTYFKCKDGYAFLSGFSDINWKALCTILKRPDLQGQYPTIFDRLNVDNMKLMYKEIEKWTTARTYDEIYDAVMDYNKNIAEGIVVPGRVTPPMETMKTENWWVRRSLEKFNDPYYGELTVANQAWKMTGTPPRLKWLCRPVGGDNVYIYSRRLGLGPKQLEPLKEKGII